MENGSSINDEATQCQKYGTSVCVKRKCAHNRIYDALYKINFRQRLNAGYGYQESIRKIRCMHFYHYYHNTTYNVYCLLYSNSTHSEDASDFLILGLLGLRYWR